MDIKIGKKCVYTTVMTPKGIVTGYSTLFKPSTTFNKKGVYSVNLLLNKEDGEALAAQVKEVQKEQFKNFKKTGDKLTEILAIKPLTTVNEETGEETADAEGRYILKAKNSAQIEDDVINFHVAVFDSKLKPIKTLKLGEGSVLRLKLDLVGYSMANKVGVSIKLKAAQVIEYVPYSEQANAAEGFEVEEGFELEDEEIEAEEAKATDEVGEDEEDDF